MQKREIKVTLNQSNKHQEITVCQPRLSLAKPVRKYKIYK